MLDFEAALARAEAAVGMIAAEDAEAIGRACRAEDFDVAELGAAAAASGNPVVPLVRALRDRLEPRAAEAVHRGAASPGGLDPAAVLRAPPAPAPPPPDLRGAARPPAG